MSTLDLEKIPYFPIVGVVLIVSMFLYTTDAPNFGTQILPTYLTQALVYIAFGYSFLRGYTDRGFIVFAMALDWLMMQILVWSNVAGLAFSLWMLCLIQLMLAYMFFSGYKAKFAGQGGPVWSYAGLWLVFAFGIAKLWIIWAAAQSLVALPFWGFGIALLSFGYIIQPVKDEWSMPFKLIGTLLAVIAAFTVQASGLVLIP